MRSFTRKVRKHEHFADCMGQDRSWGSRSCTLVARALPVARTSA
jgi:hypothetical protein